MVLKGVIVKSYRANGIYRQIRKIFKNDCESVGGAHSELLVWRLPSAREMGWI